MTSPLEINPTGTTSALGRAIRLRRLFGTSGRTVTVALDQAIPRGVAPRLATIGTTYAGIAGGAPDAVTMCKGVAGHVLARTTSAVPWILKASMFSVDFHPHYDAVIGDVRDAVRMGADAVAVGISAGSSNQPRDLEMLSGTVEEAAKVGLPVVCHAYPTGELWPEEKKGTVEAVLYASRMAAELGVDIVKTWYTGSTEEFRSIVEGTPAIVVAAGGAKAGDPMQVLRQAASVVAAGGHGVTFGRNVWGADDPGRMVSALRAVVHDGLDPEKAAELLK
ncbi:2-amino-3,7-dideoxy-D-threo-hept-6-ulosonate synthase [Actinomadura vinacea]|uniref:2-amino-3,7-dideoxy-D-threo-hept-6-ulosonate synthase n=1 Tax=Actinomadura vinacea TaxID=115336 RepID=A0ABP5VIG5_9ACTN